MFVNAGSASQKSRATKGVFPDANGWVRPYDWPALPPSNPNEVDGLMAVYASGPNLVALQATVSSGTYTVNWGDGSAAQTYTSGTTASYQYTYGASGLGPLTSEGYQTAIVNITPTSSSANITGITLSGVKNSTLSIYPSIPWLDLQVNCPSLTTLLIGSGSNWTNLTLQRCNIIAISSSITTLGNAFYGCSSLQSVSFPSGSLTGITNLTSAFENCYSLRSVSFPAGSLASVTTLGNIFWNCQALQSVAFPSGALPVCTNLSTAFYNCFNIQSITFPALGSLTTIANAFSGCAALETLAFPAGTALNSGSLTTTTAFSGCTSLASVSNCSVGNTFTLNGNLTASALNALFTALPSVSSKTLTCSSNPGYGSSTTSIATGKGWTLA